MCLVVAYSLRIIMICCVCLMSAMVHFHVFISRGVGSNLQFANKLVGIGYMSILVCMNIQ